MLILRRLSSLDLAMSPVDNFAMEQRDDLEENVIDDSGLGVDYDSAPVRQGWDAETRTAAAHLFARRRIGRLHPETLRRLHAETQDFIARGDIKGLAAAMRADADGVAARLARRLRNHP